MQEQRWKTYVKKQHALVEMRPYEPGEDMTGITVSEKDNPRYYRLLHQFAALTGLPVLLNTSFNRAGEPIVCSPSDAVTCFLESGLDALVIGDYVAIPENGPGGERR